MRSMASSMAAALAVTSPSHLPKLVILDRDGVINEDVGAPGVVLEDQFRLTPGAASAVGRLKRRGCRVAVATNQSCVGKGLLSPSGLEDIHRGMARLLARDDDSAAIDRIYVCTSTASDDPRRKPNPGMIAEACRDFDVDPADAVFVGDTLTDLQAAKSGGIRRRVLVETGYGLGLMGGRSASIPAEVVEEKDLGEDSAAPSSLRLDSVTPVLYASNLEEAVNSIIGVLEE